MSELDKKSDSSTPNENSNQDEAFSIIKVDDFVMYSDSIDDKMTEMARNFNAHNEIQWSRWNLRRDVNDEDSDSEEETSYSRIPLKSPQRVIKSSKKKQSMDNTERDVINKKCNRIVETDFEENIDSYQEDLHVSENNFSGQDSVQELMRKFSIIETLRQKENLKKDNFPGTSEFNPSAGMVYGESEDTQKKKTPEFPETTKFSPAEKVRDESEENQRKEISEAFLGWRKSQIGKEDFERKDKSGSSEKPHPEDDDDEIDEIVKMLSNSSLIKDYYDVVSFPNRDEEIVRAFIDQSPEIEKRLDGSSGKPEIEVPVDDILGTEFGVISPENVHSDELILDWKNDIAGELRHSFDGYEIDDQSSFHDWMVYHQGI